MKVAVVEFLGSNCDHDATEWASRIFGLETSLVWFASEDLGGADLVILPGGFSYGDYLRCGAMAARTPVMKAVKAHAQKGGLVLGICNGFQVLCESGLLPGALMKNECLTFLCRDVCLRCETTNSPFTGALERQSLLRMPIAHGEGNYFAGASDMQRLKDEDRIAFRYVDPSGKTNPAWNVNGSMDAIAGVLSEGRNVLGMMPHPERASELLMGSMDGAPLLSSAVSALEASNG